MGMTERTNKHVGFNTHRGSVGSKITSGDGTTMSSTTKINPKEGDIYIGYEPSGILYYTGSSWEPIPQILKDTNSTSITLSGSYQTICSITEDVPVDKPYLTTLSVRITSASGVWFKLTYQGATVGLWNTSDNYFSISVPVDTTKGTLRTFVWSAYGTGTVATGYATMSLIF